MDRDSKSSMVVSKQESDKENTPLAFTLSNRTGEPIEVRIDSVRRVCKDGTSLELKGVRFELRLQWADWPGAATWCNYTYNDRDMRAYVRQGYRRVGHVYPATPYVEQCMRKKFYCFQLHRVGDVLFLSAIRVPGGDPLKDIRADGTVRETVPIRTARRWLAFLAKHDNVAKKSR